MATHRQARCAENLVKSVHVMTRGFYRVTLCFIIRNGTPLTEINNAVDDGPVSRTYTALDANTLRLRLHRFDFLCICCKLACTIRRQQIDQVEFGPYRVCRPVC